MKIQQYEIIKIPIKELIDNDYIISIDKESLINKDYIIKQPVSLLFDQIEQLRGYFSSFIDELILVEAKKNKNTNKQLEFILRNGFILNNKKYLRFGKSQSQGKDGITAFVSEDIFERLYQITQLDIEIEECVISKYESQRCLMFTSCTLIKDYNPYIVIVDEYEKVIPHQLIRYVVEKEKEFVDKNTGEIKKYKSREIEEDFKDVKISPFDGCGCHEREFSEKITQLLDVDYLVDGIQVRKPFVKGYSVYVPFKTIFKDWGITTITDVYGKVHNINDIDCIWNTSMFKGHKIFKNKYGKEAWNEYNKVVQKYNIPLGVSKYSHHLKNLNKMARLNFQYLQCLDLQNPKYAEWFETKGEYSYNILDKNNQGKIINIAKYTTDLFEKIIKGDKFYTYKFMGINETDGYNAESNYLKAVMVNDIMLKDVAVKQFIYRKLKKSIQEAKLGKIYAEGFYHTVVGDMYGYLQYVAGLPVDGCLKSKEFYCKTLPQGKAISMRSPLVCPSEVNDINIVSNEIIKKYFNHFENQDIVMLNIYDLSLPQQGGMDEDGDAVYLTNNPIIVSSKIDKPIIIDIEDKVAAKSVPYNIDNIVKFELNSRDSRIGEITNVATGIENRYTSDTKVKKIYDDFVSLLRVIQGKEIDSLKTGVRWHMNKGLRKYGKQLPYFLLHNYPQKMKTYEKLRNKNKDIKNKKDRVILNAYKSPSPMNELCDYIETWERKNILWDNNTVDTRCLIINNSLNLNDKSIIKKIRHEINCYSTKLKEIIKVCELNQDYSQVDVLIEDYKTRLFNIIPNEELLANYVIKISYSNNTISKNLAWNAYGDYIVKNLNENSNPKRNITIRETPYQTENSYEYLGKYYEMKRVGDGNI